MDAIFLHTGRYTVPVSGKSMKTIIQIPVINLGIYRSSYSYPEVLLIFLGQSLVDVLEYVGHDRPGGPLVELNL